MMNIGIQPEAVPALAQGLNRLLANYMVFYQNTRSLHWNIRGDKFFELHLKFEELYNDLLLKVDEVAERILTLGHTPLHTFEDYLQVAEIEVVKNVSDATPAVKAVVEGLGVLLRQQRALLDLSSESGDEGTNALMSDYIREQEKLVWMYRAWLG